MLQCPVDEGPETNWRWRRPDGVWIAASGPASAAAHAVFFFFFFLPPPLLSFPSSRAFSDAVHQTWLGVLDTTQRTHSRLPASQVALAPSNKPDQPTIAFLRPRRPALPQPSVSRRSLCGNVLRSSRRLLPSPPLPSLTSSLFLPSSIDLYSPSPPLLIPRRRSDAKLLLFLRLPLVPPSWIHQ